MICKGFIVVETHHSTKNDNILYGTVIASFEEEIKAWDCLKNKYLTCNERGDTVLYNDDILTNNYSILFTYNPDISDTIISYTIEYIENPICYLDTYIIDFSNEDFKKSYKKFKEIIDIKYGDNTKEDAIIRDIKKYLEIEKKLAKGIPQNLWHTDLAYHNQLALLLNIILSDFYFKNVFKESKEFLLNKYEDETI